MNLVRFRRSLAYSKAVVGLDRKSIFCTISYTLIRPGRPLRSYSITPLILCDFFPLNRSSDCRSSSDLIRFRAQNLHLNLRASSRLSSRMGSLENRENISSIKSFTCEVSVLMSVSYNDNQKCKNRHNLNRDKGNSTKTPT